MLIMVPTDLPRKPSLDIKLVLDKLLVEEWLDKLSVDRSDRLLDNRLVGMATFVVLIDSGFEFYLFFEYLQFIEYRQL